MPSISWNEGSPAGADSVGLGAGEFRSLKTAIRTGLDAEHNWPSAGGDAGVHRLGSGRPYVGVQSAVSSTGTDGRIMIASDTSRLFGVGSTGTMFLGGDRVLSVGSAPTGGQRFYWATEFGVTTATGATGTSITFPNSGFSGVPFVQISAWTDNTSSVAMALKMRALTPTSMVVVGLDTNDVVVSNWTIQWLSIGTRTF